tara:strand:- start:699 stop:845 length:147 start_codon:yes stop_codon:yes gene_type:complete
MKLNLVEAEEDVCCIFRILWWVATGFEPVTPAVSRQYSTAELRTHKKL